MKKTILIVVGLVVVIGAVLLIGRSGKEERLTTKYTEVAKEEGGGAQASATEGREASATPDNEPEKSVQSADKLPVELSEAVKALLGQDGKKHNYPSLLAAINELDVDNMSAVDVAALMEMLNWPNDRFPEKMRSIEINAVKNDVLDKLLRQKDLPEGLGLQMVEMAADPSNDSVWRDYSIQFMGQFYDRFKAEDGDQTTEVGSQKNAESSAIHDAMFSALDERSETLAGTALIGLELLSRTHEEFDRELIVERTVEIASDETASPSSRLTAMRLSAQISNSEQGTPNVEVVQTARALAQTGETILLRSAAIVTLGETGTAADRELLESFTFSENKQIAAAAEMALQKLEDTLRQQNDA